MIASTFRLTALVVAGAVCVLTLGELQAQPRNPLPPSPEVAAEDLGEQVLTQGPLHEAFAEPVLYDLQNHETIFVTQQPPAAIEEIPAEVKPDADAEWIPGYWSWDADDNRFVWVSGIWRVTPIGKQWVPGYWTAVEGGFTWVPGFWADQNVQELAYLPYPPQSVEAGPNQPAPSDNFFWIPGCWLWRNGQYVWRPGHWAEIQEGWVWVPAHYSWTPYGCIFVPGFWDFVVEERGLVFAPVYFPPTIQNVVYSPQFVIDVNVLVTHLFVRPSHCHYYFGDYYADRHARRGIVPWVSYSRRRFAYDPLFTYQRWRHRGDRDWVQHLTQAYEIRREREDLRPPRTLVEQRQVVARIDAAAQPDRIRTVALAEPVKNLIGRDSRERTGSGWRPSVTRITAAQREQVAKQTVVYRDVRQARAEQDRHLAPGVRIEKGGSDGDVRIAAPDRSRGPVVDPKSPAVAAPKRAELRLPHVREAAPRTDPPGRVKEPKVDATERPKPEPRIIDRGPPADRQPADRTPPGRSGRSPRVAPPQPGGGNDRDPSRVEIPKRSEPMPRRTEEPRVKPEPSVREPMPRKTEEPRVRPQPAVREPMPPRRPEVKPEPAPREAKPPMPRKMEEPRVRPQPAVREPMPPRRPEVKPEPAPPREAKPPRPEPPPMKVEKPAPAPTPPSEKPKEESPEEKERKKKKGK